MKNVPRLLPTIIVSSAVVVIGWQLMLPPVVGLSNNGDFGKVLGNFGLGAPRDHEHVFADTTYDFDSRYFYRAGFSSSESILSCLHSLSAQCFPGMAASICGMFSRRGHGTRSVPAFCSCLVTSRT